MKKKEEAAVPKPSIPARPAAVEVEEVPEETEEPTEEEENAEEEAKDEEAGEAGTLAERMIINHEQVITSLEKRLTNIEAALFRSTLE